jgi:RNA polymerase sigma factor (sigma-70 family)
MSSNDQAVNIDKQPVDKQPFESLLIWLDSDRERAGGLYEQVRTKLIRFYEFRGCPFPEELADDTIQRGARKISEDTIFRPPDPFIYFRGIARNVLLEYLKNRKKRPTTVFDDLPPSNLPAIDPVELEKQSMMRSRKERMLECLDDCLSHLPSESRELFVEYNRDQKRERIDNRLLIAERIGIDINALRSRVTRIRERLKSCIAGCARQ